MPRDPEQLRREGLLQEQILRLQTLLKSVHYTQAETVDLESMKALADQMERVLTEGERVKLVTAQGRAADRRRLAMSERGEDVGESVAEKARAELEKRREAMEPKPGLESPDKEIAEAESAVHKGKLIIRDVVAEGEPTPEEISKTEAETRAGAHPPDLARLEKIAREGRAQELLDQNPELTSEEKRQAVADAAVLAAREGGPPRAEGAPNPDQVASGREGVLAGKPRADGSAPEIASGRDGVQAGQRLAPETATQRAIRIDEEKIAAARAERDEKAGEQPSDVMRVQTPPVAVPGRGRGFRSKELRDEAHEEGVARTLQRKREMGAKATSVTKRAKPFKAAAKSKAAAKPKGGKGGRPAAGRPGSVNRPSASE